MLSTFVRWVLRFNPLTNVMTLGWNPMALFFTQNVEVLLTFSKHQKTSQDHHKNILVMSETFSRHFQISCVVLWESITKHILYISIIFHNILILWTKMFFLILWPKKIIMETFCVFSVHNTRILNQCGWCLQGITPHTWIHECYMPVRPDSIDTKGFCCISVDRMLWLQLVQISV